MNGLAASLINTPPTNMANSNRVEILFDSLLFQTQRGGVTHEQLERGIRYDQFEQVKPWQLRYGYKFNVYGNDHLIDGKPHFHFDNREENVSCKVDFNGNILESNGKNSMSPKIMKELLYFLSKEANKNRIIEMWNEKNPSLVISPL
jgi:Domain of unknown function (DUF4160)